MPPPTSITIKVAHLRIIWLITFMLTGQWQRPGRRGCPEAGLAAQWAPWQQQPGPGPDVAETVQVIFSTSPVVPQQA
eukprot:69941-Hanusia_phi.AAC.4